MSKKEQWVRIGGGDAPEIAFRITEEKGDVMFSLHAVPAGASEPSAASLFSGFVTGKMPVQLRSLSHFMDAALARKHEAEQAAG